MKGKLLLFVGMILLLAVSVGAQSGPADTDSNGCVDIGEIVVYVELWKNSQVSIGDVVAAVEVWQLGCNQPTCTDSDGGINYYVKGTIYYDGVSSTDHCIDYGQISELYCGNNGEPSEISTSCPNGCENGACLNVTVDCMTRAEVAAERNDCLYILDGDVFKKGNYPNKHKGHTCGTDISIPYASEPYHQNRPTKINPYLLKPLCN